jgi:hypothetical protein
MAWSLQRAESNHEQLATASAQAQSLIWHMQGQAEYFLEKLHGMAEKQVGAFLDGAEAAEGWAKFRENLIGLTDVTRTHFDKLVSVRTGPSQAPQSDFSAPAFCTQCSGPLPGCS